MYDTKDSSTSVHLALRKDKNDAFAGEVESERKETLKVYDTKNSSASVHFALRKDKNGAFAEEVERGKKESIDKERVS